MRTAYKILATIAAAASMFSCVKEDLSQCLPIPPTTNTLKLRLVPRKMDITPTSADLKRAVVYIFDSSGKLFTTWDKTNPELNTTYTTNVGLGTDTYRVVAWVNPTEPFSIKPAYTPSTRSDLTDGRVTMNIPSGGEITSSTAIPMLFYGSTSQVLAPTTSDVVIDIPLTLDIYKLNFTLNDVPGDGSEYEIRITDNNGAYDFENNFVDTQSFSYVATAKAGTSGANSSLQVGLTMLRLAQGRNPQISIVNKTTGKTVFPQNGQPSAGLMDLIGQTPIDLDTTHDLQLSVNIPDGTGNVSSAVEITINGWKVVIDDYAINPY